MNIEEERKAFELILESEIGLSSRRLVSGDYQSFGAAIGFQSWLAAKAHAEEMAKPVVECWQAMSDEWRVVYPGTHNDVFPDKRFATEAEATKRLELGGYRVVGE